MFLWALALGYASAEPMVVFLKNGDRFTGEISSENAKRVILRTPVTGKITVPRDQIARMVTPKALAAETAALAAASTQTTASTTAPASAKPTTPPAPQAPATIAPAPVAALATNKPLVPESWMPLWFNAAWTNWHGAVQLGANLGYGTTDRHAVFFTANATKKWGRTTTLVNYNVSYGVVNDVVNANRMEGDTKVDVELSRNHKLYAYGLGGVGYDDIRQIDMEYLIGSGLGYKFINQPKLVLAGEVGGQYQVYEYFFSPGRENVAARFGETLTIQFPKSITLTQRLGFTPGLDDFSDYQIRFGATLSLPLIKPLTFNLNVIDEYDSMPAPGISNNELQISTTIGVNF